MFRGPILTHRDFGRGYLENGLMSLIIPIPRQQPLQGLRIIHAGPAMAMAKYEPSIGDKMTSSGFNGLFGRKYGLGASLLVINIDRITAPDAHRRRCEAMQTVTLLIAGGQRR